jgi:hypothetical protein
VKQAAMVDPRYKNQKEKVIHHGCIDEFLIGKTQEARKNVDPLHIAAMLDENLSPTQPEDGELHAQIHSPTRQNTGPGCGGFQIM